MNIGIYARKSRYTESGASIETQINICKEYCDKISDNNIYTTYIDEGWTGTNIERPGLKQLINDIDSNKIDHVVVYRLDRISRNVSDFCKLIQLLNKRKVKFISVKEGFDTTSPMGTALMSTSAVFAQLESRIIKERVTDNMYRLAERGIWLGGVTPMGYKSIKTKGKTFLNNTKSHMELEIDEDEAKLVEYIFDKYLELNSLKKVSDHLNELGYLSRRGGAWCDSSIRKVLINITYAKSTPELFEYFKEKNVIINGEPDNIHGVMAFGKDGPNEIYTMGSHIAFIDSKKWIQAQKLLHKQKSPPKKDSYKIGLLRDGLLRCGVCGDRYGVKFKNRPSGGTDQYYMCNTKRRESLKVCNSKNIKLENLDEFILNQKNLFSCEKSPKNNNKYRNDEQILLNTLKRKELEIDQMIKSLIDHNSDDIEQIMSDIDNIGEEINQLKKQIQKLQENFEEHDINISCKSEVGFASNDTVSLRNNLKKVVDYIVWNGEAETLEVIFLDKSKEKCLYSFTNRTTRK